MKWVIEHGGGGDVVRIATSEGRPNRRGSCALRIKFLTLHKSRAAISAGRESKGPLTPICLQAATSL
jgi:hypothetical protein